MCNECDTCFPRGLSSTMDKQHISGMSDPLLHDGMFFSVILYCPTSFDINGKSLA